MAALPCISKLFEEGRLTYSKVRIVTRVATGESDAKYAELALDNPVHFIEDIVRIHKKIDGDAAERMESRRYLDISTDDDGMVIVRARLAPDEGAIFKKAIDAAMAAGAGERCVALTEVATAGVEKLATGDDAILHVENSEHVCAVEGHACSRATADRLICQNPHARKASAPQVRALRRLQGGYCAYPGCTHRHFLQSHHIILWSRGGLTRLENLVLICGKHHRILHEGGYRLAREKGELVFRSDRGLLIPRAPKLPAVTPGERNLATTPTPSIDALYPGEFFTNREHRDCSIEWLLQH